MDGDLEDAKRKTNTITDVAYILKRQGLITSFVPFDDKFLLVEYLFQNAE